MENKKAGRWKWDLFFPDLFVTYILQELQQVKNIHIKFVKILPELKVEYRIIKTVTDE